MKIENSIKFLNWFGKEKLVGQLIHIGPMADATVIIMHTFLVEGT